MTNVKLLRDKIKESGLKLGYIAGKLGLTYQGLWKKLNNLSEFKQSEIPVLCEVLGIKSAKEKELIFFAKDVDKTAT